MTPGLGRSPGEVKGYPLQYSGLEDSMDCIVHGIAKSCTRLSDFHFHFSRIKKVKMALHITCLNLFHNLTISEQWSGEMSDCSEPHSPGLDCYQAPAGTPTLTLPWTGSSRVPAKKCDPLTTVTSLPFPSFRQTLSSTQGGSGSEGAQLALVI